MRLQLLVVSCALLAGCGLGGGPKNPLEHSTAAARLKPVTAPLDASWRSGRTYVPVYSSLDWGFDNVVVDLAVTLSIRNVTLAHGLAIEAVDYYDSTGARLRSYLPQPSQLPAMASVEYVIAKRDSVGGPGANFVVDWSVPGDGEDPFIEAVMVGQHGNAGISFTSPGRSTRRVTKP